MKHPLITTIAAVLLVGCGTIHQSVVPAPYTYTSIHQAAMYGSTKTVKQHLATGTDVDAKRSRSGSTPLHPAAYRGHKEIVELLLAEGADVNARRSKYGGGYTPLHVAATEGHKEIAELLINKGSDVNAKEDFLGRTPLHYAGTKEMIELLIDNGADVNAKANGITPLDWAIQREQTEIAKPLRKHGGKTGEQLKAEGK